jgi:cyanophycin synthetase
MSNRNIKISLKNLDKFDFTVRELMSEALRRGWAVEYSRLLPDDSVSGIAECKKSRQRIIFRTDHTILAPVFAYYAAENKNLTAALFEKSHIPTPPSQTVALSVGDEVLQEVLGKYQMIVVKPLSSNHGRGITIGVDSSAKLKKALEFVRETKPSDRFALLQKQIVGAKEYRFLVLEGKVIAVSHRRPPFVIGDGVRNVRGLITELNLDPRRGAGHKAALTKISLREVAKVNGPDFLDTIPTKGKVVEVLKTSNLSRGGIAEDFTETVGEELKQIAIRAAKSCFLGLAGVDIMTSDIKNGSNSFVIEVNSAPGLRMHESPSIGQPRNVVSQIFDALEAHATESEE